jgi:hypothetical protein
MFRCPRYYQPEISRPTVHPSLADFHVDGETAAMEHSRKIYLNGKFVGEVPITGDDTRDQNLAIQLLKDKGLYQETTLVQSMFRQAVSFATTASYLYKRDLTHVPRNGLSVVPFVVNSAFAIELYLKTLGQLHNTGLRGHDLLKLFDGLPADAQMTLQQNFSKSAWQCDIKTLAEYRGALQEMRNAFVEWRYLYEEERSGAIHFQPMIFLMNVLHETCRARDEVRGPTAP